MKKPYHLNDKLLKSLAESMELVFKNQGIKEKVIESLPNEYIYNTNKYILDYPCKMADGVYRNLEFQTAKPSKDKIEKLIIYECLLNFNKEGNAEVSVVALYPTDKKEIVKKINERVVFKFPVICLKNINADKELKTITKKINNNQKLTKDEIDYLCLMPLFQTTKPSEKVLEDIIHLTNKLDPNSKEFYRLKSSQILYTQVIIKNKYKRKELMDVIDMKVNLFEEAKEYGREEGKIELIQSMLLKGISPENIAESTDMDLEFIQKVSLNK